MKLLLHLAILLGSIGGVNDFDLNDCDLLFQDLDCGPLCEAIEEVTEGIDGANFSHIGMVVLTDSGVYVLEAISDGVVQTALAEFLERSADKDGNPKIIVGRLKKEYSGMVPEIKDKALAYLGEDYDAVYSMDNDTYYCSELLYFCFSEASADKNFFEIQAMTFKPAGAEDYFPAWESYYANLFIPIPEGEPGLNPGSISCSDKIEIVHAFGKPRGYIPPR